MAKKRSKRMRELIYFRNTFEEQLVNVAKDKTITSEEERTEVMVMCADKIRELETDIEALEEKEKKQMEEEEDSK